jgi:hypothetical protein
MADFTVLPVYDGVGPYHFNRYRVVFQNRPGLSVANLAADFVRNFPQYLNSDYATVDWGGTRTFNSKPTLKFHGFLKYFGGRIDIAQPHNDWVVQEWCNPSVGFTAQTLKREFFDLGEDGEASVGAAVPGGAIGAGVGGAVIGIVTAVGVAAGAVHYNRMHFLAGRRSWRVGDGTAFGVKGDVSVLETIAVERFSARFYQTGDHVLALEEKIPDIWIANLNNFIKKWGLNPIGQSLRANWKTKYRNIYYFVKIDFKDLDSLRAHPEFLDAYPLFRTILP